MTERAAVRRKVVAVIAVGGLALTALSACRTEAGAAAYVGGTRITQSQVNEIVASIPASTLKKANVSHTTVTSSVVQALTFNAVAAAFAKKNGYGTAKPEPSEVVSTAAGIGVSGPQGLTNKYALVGAQLDAWRTLLLSKMPAGAPTEADFKAVFDELVSSKQLVPGTQFAQVEPDLKQYAPSNLAQANTLRTRLNSEITSDNVSINPQYTDVCTVAPCGGLALPLTELDVPDSSGQTQQIPIMIVNMGQDASPVVLDLPSASPSA